MEAVRKVYPSELFTTGVLMSGSDNTVRAALEEIGLSQHEIAVYRTALTLGPRPASTLAKTIRIQRTRVYDLLSSLQARGLIEMVERNSVRYYGATSPDRILSLLRDRKEEVQSQLRHLEQIMPKLRAGSQSFCSSVESRTVRGAGLVRELIEEILDSSDGALFSIGDIEGVLRTNVGTSRWAGQFRDKRVAAGITLRVSLQGPPDFLEEKALLRETLSSPDIPDQVLALANADTIAFFDFSTAAQATRIDSPLFCSILLGLYRAWLGAVARTS